MSANASAAKPAPAPKPWWLPLVGICIALPLAYSLFAAPLMAAVANPDQNAAQLVVNVVDFDGGLIGQQFTQFWASYPAGSSWYPATGAAPVTIPGTRILSALTTSPDAERAAVRSSAVYASIFVNPGASARLTAALSSPAAAAAYDPSSAITIVWDEARNNAVTTARVGGPLKGLTDAFAFRMAVSAHSLMAQLQPTATAAALVDYARVLGLPVFFREETLFPMTAPVLNQALAVGQILLCVFSLVAVNMLWGPLRALWEGAAPGLPRAARQAALLATLCAFVSAAYTTALVGLANDNNLTRLNIGMVPGVAFGSPNMVGFWGGAVWAQIWACQWLMMLVLALWLAVFATLAGGPAVAAALLAPMIVSVLWGRCAALPAHSPHSIYFETPPASLYTILPQIFNSISLSTDVSNPGYQFFYYAPFWHSSEIVRFVMFGTLSSRLSMHVGIHWLWLGLELLAFGAAHARAARAAAAAAAAAAATAAPVLSSAEPAAAPGDKTAVV